MRTLALAVMMLCSFPIIGQEVQVTPGKGSVALSISAQKPYRLLANEEKLPVLSVTCGQKGKRNFHWVMFSPGGSVAEDKPEAGGKGGVIFNMTLGGTKQVTTWAPYGDASTFVYFGKTEAERAKFVQALLSSPTASVEFTPFLTGTSVTSVFDLSKLRDAMDKYPECVAR